MADVALDQGRQVRLSWRPSTFDDPDCGDPVVGYSIWRRIARLQAREQDCEHPTGSAQVSYPPGVWDYVNTVPARCEGLYNCVVPTLCDSTARGMCWSVFFVSAMTDDPSVYFDSPPDSGYSVDNLAPLPPENLWFMSPAELAWDECQDADFDHFSVYGSLGSAFDGSAALIGQTCNTFWDIMDKIFTYYHVTATDFAGNEGLASSIAAAASVSEYALLQNRPNPFGTETDIRFHLPRPTRVTLSVFDVNGKLVNCLVRDALPAGRHSVEWLGSDHAEHGVGSGVYFVHIEAGTFSATKKILLLRGRD